MNNHEFKQIEIELFGLDWILDVEYTRGFNNGDPRDEIEPQLISWSIDCVYYDNGSYEFSADTVNELKLAHYKELRAEILPAIFK